MNMTQEQAIKLIEQNKEILSQIADIHLLIIWLVVLVGAIGLLLPLIKKE
jgi:hypothetical protein